MFNLTKHQSSKDNRGLWYKISYKDQLPGGKGDKTKPEDVDRKQLSMGIEHELEHTNEKEIAREIAIDHLTEDPGYYTKLNQMESDKKSKNTNSNIKKLFGNDFLSIFETKDGYTFVKNRTGRGIAFLGYKKDKDKILYMVRFEKVPPRNPSKPFKELPISLVSLTGMIENGESPIETVIREVKEESGFKVTKKDLISLGFVCPNKSVNEKVFLFCADLTEKKQGRANGDGTVHEKESYCEFVDFEKLLESDDPLLHSLFMRFSKKIVY